MPQAPAKKKAVPSMRRPTAAAIINKSEPRYGEHAPRISLYPSPELLARMKAAQKQEAPAGRPPLSLNAWILGIVFDHLERSNIHG